MEFELPPGAGTVTAPGSVDTAAVSTLLDAASSLLDGGSTAIVLDASQVTSIDAGGQAGLQWLAAAVRARGATAHIYYVPPSIALALGDAINAFDSARVS